LQTLEIPFDRWPDIGEMVRVIAAARGDDTTRGE
jgi:hypothetical protein